MSKQKSQYRSLFVWPKTTPSELDLLMAELAMDGYEICVVLPGDLHVIIFGRPYREDAVQPGD